MKYFTINELSKSATAKRLGIDNTPDKKVSEEITKLINNILDPLREAWGAPLIVTSGYRSPKLNKAVGGAVNSQHKFGQAADINVLGDATKDNKSLFDLAHKMIKENKIKVGQLIWEYGDKEGPSWIHISTPGNHVNQIVYIGKK